MVGSSPRMRGALNGILPTPEPKGIIPADAGSTSFTVSHPSTQRDHPRGCGEHDGYRSGAFAGKGSSPRMRGALPHTGCRAALGGIISADAGSTMPNLTQQAISKDHPRGCGEHCRIPAAEQRLAGSSPRMRGAQCLISHSKPSRRIIPADAGSTEWKARGSAVLMDHPRGCGEHRYSCLGSYTRAGSSPRMRGALSVRGIVIYPCGIIPADAGSTWGRDLFWFPVWDHPRGCGEHTKYCKHWLT